MREGVVVLMHDRILSTMDILLPDIIRCFEDRSYKFGKCGWVFRGKKERVVSRYWMVRLNLEN